MSVTAFKTFIAGEVLTAADLNSSLSQVFDNGEDLAWPATKAKDLDGQELILDSDADTSITADTDDQIDIKIGGTDRLAMTNTAAVFNFICDMNGKELVLDADGDTSITADTDDQIDIKVAGADTIRIKSSVYLREIADANADEAAFGQLWVNIAVPNELWFTDDAGGDFLLSVGQAVQADIEAETNENTYVPPDLMVHHPGVAKVWVHYTSTSGAPVILDSYGVSSLTDLGTGNSRVNYSTAFSAADNHCANVTMADTLAGSNAPTAGAYLVGSVTVTTALESPADTTQNFDTTHTGVSVFGDL